MRVGIYVDAFNVYYGGRTLAERDGREVPWKWLDLAALCDSLIDRESWVNARISRLVYCSAPRSAAGDVRGSEDQRRYFSALAARAREGGYAMTLELGYYVHTEKSGLLLHDRRGAPIPWGAVESEPSLPAWLSLRSRTHTDGAEYALGSFKTFEEKGTDVNVATHLIADIYGGEVDAAIVLSNDSDLELPIRLARERVPVGHVNPSARPTAGRLKGQAQDGVGRHWWRRLTVDDLAAHQLPPSCGGADKPADW